MPSAGFEPTISADGRPQTHVLDRAATGTVFVLYCIIVVTCLMTVGMDPNMLHANDSIQYTCVLDSDSTVYLLVGEVQHTIVFLF